MFNLLKKKETLSLTVEQCGIFNETAAVITDQNNKRIVVEDISDISLNNAWGLSVALATVFNLAANKVGNKKIYLKCNDNLREATQIALRGDVHGIQLI